MINLNDPVTIDGAIALGGTPRFLHYQRLWARWEDEGEVGVCVWWDGKVELFDIEVPITTLGQLALLLSLLGLGDNSLDAQLAEAITTAAPHDPEVAHVYADNLLVEIVRSAKLPKMVEAFEKLSKWYS